MAFQSETMKDFALCAPGSLMLSPGVRQEFLDTGGAGVIEPDDWAAHDLNSTAWPPPYRSCLHLIGTARERRSGKCCIINRLRYG